jgi:hypothetical protein
MDIFALLMRNNILLFFLSLIAVQLNAQDAIYAEGKSRLTPVIEEWKTLPRDSNKSFVQRHSRNADAAPRAFHAGTFLPGSETALKEAKITNVIGPFTKANAEYLLRVDSTGMTSDSVQAAHILIAWRGAAGTLAGITRTREQAKKRADSLCNLIVTGKATFESFVIPGMTDDPGSLSGNQGNYGWFTRETPFVEVFKHGAFAHAVGETFVFESDFGFHIMQVKAKTKEYYSYFAWQIVKIIDSCFLEDGITPNVWPGGYTKGSAVLDKVIAQQRLQYPSIAQVSGSGSVMVLFDIAPSGTVSAVRLQYAEGLTPRQRTEITKLFLSLRGFTAERTCSGPTGQTEIYMFRL